MNEQQAMDIAESHNLGKVARTATPVFSERHSCRAWVVEFEDGTVELVLDRDAT